MADLNEDPNSNAGAVFGFFPQFAGKKKTSYATDAALRTGYQANPVGGFQPAEPSVPSAQQALPTDIQPSTAGAGRGSVNPPAGAPPTESASYDPSVAAQGAGAGRGFNGPPTVNADMRPDLAGVPNLGGSTGTAVTGAPGARKFVTADGRTLYSNVAGTDNNTLMSDKPGLQVAPAVGGFTPTTQPANANPGLTILPDTGGYGLRDAGVLAARNAQGFSVLGGTGKLQNDAQIAAAHDATLRANNQDTTSVALAGQQTQAATAGARLGFDQANATYTNANTAATTAHTQAQTQAALDLQAARLAYGKAVASGDAKAIQAAEDGLRAAQGKWEKEIPDIYNTTALPAAVGLDGTKVPGGAIVTNKRTGETKILTQGDVAPQAPKYETGKVYIDGQGNKRKWDGKQFVPV